MTERKNVPLNILLPPKLKKDLREFARSQDRDMSAQARWILKKFFKDKRGGDAENN